MLETLVWWLIVAFVVISAAGIAAFFVVRWAFLRVATRMSLAIERRVGAVAAGALTRLGSYAKSAGIDLSEADRRFGRHIDGLARLMDSAVTLPLLGPVGLDAVLGLVPGRGRCRRVSHLAGPRCPEPAIRSTGRAAVANAR